MTEEAGIARLWQGFHHLSETDKDLVLTVAEAVKRSEPNDQAVHPTKFPAIPEQVEGFYGTVSQEREKKN